MDSIKSFKGYGKVDPAEEQTFRRKTRRRLLFLVLSSIVLISIIVGAVIGVVMHNKNNGSSSNSSPSSTTQLTPEASLKAVCSVTQYPVSCYSSISPSFSSENINTTDPEAIFKQSLLVVLDALSKVKDLPNELIQGTNDTVLKGALGVCSSVFDDAVGRLNDSVSTMVVRNGEQVLSPSKIDDLKTWLSSAITDQETCLDALQELNTTDHYNSTILEQVQKATKNSTEFSSNSLAIVTKILSILSTFNIPIHRKLLSHHIHINNNDFPRWVSLRDRRLLEDTTLTPNITVTKDGSGDAKTINEAVAKIPKKSASRFIIYVKAGLYVEKVTLDKNTWNVMIYGDGIDETIISGSLNFVDGTPTFATATLSVMGKGFIAKNIKFMNTAGAAKHQAVAFRSGSDMSVYYQCAFDAYQDTLYAHSNRQFYRDCQITGTIDFIFGNAAVVFQNCIIQPRQPLVNQFNTITAQGKMDSNQNTGISIQKSTISANGNLTAPTYFGRPWKNYSTTVFMESDIGSFLNSLGWTPWISGVDPPTTIFYGEYQNTGPGSSVAGRVNWTGYYPNLTVDQAGKFTVGSLIQGSEWLTATTVTYDNAL